MHEWKTTKLYEKLKGRPNAGHSLSVLELAMPDIEAVLSASGTSATSFTLHDANHALRVATMMAKLLPANTLQRLSPLELSLLILSAYLHDIGMTPYEGTPKNLYKFLLTNDPGTLDPSEITQFQRWLDEHWGGVTPPLQQGQVSINGINEAEEIIAYYSRYKHNDWSELWIRKNLSDHSKTLYANWTNDLVRLCRSHHDGLTELRSSAFDARLVGNPAQVVNLRYLAVVLRVSDVLEFDPERTPDIILRQRDIMPASRIFWQKDHSIAFTIDEKQNAIFFSARTPNALVHNAVITTAQDVDRELSTCSMLDFDDKLKQGTIPDDQRSIYVWPWPARLNTNIAEANDAFVYINGSFRPAADRILDLLSGTALYGTPMAAVRELLQNSFDAVREQIAYERLMRDAPLNDAAVAALAELSSITLTLALDGDRYWLICSDNGVGMTKEIVEKHLLVSGSPIRADVRELERSAARSGFQVGRTGRFGIGVLSYFMLGDYLEIDTRRSQEAGDTDALGWTFKTDGINGFGELLKSSRGTRGTDVKLRLRADLIGDDPGKWFEALESYVQQTVRYAPCRFEVRNDVVTPQPRPVVSTGCGWTNKIEEQKEQLLWGFHFRASNTAFRTKKDDDNIAKLEEDWKAIRGDALAKLEFYGPQEFQLPDALGKGRIWIPYFELSGGSSLRYMKIVDGRLCSLPNNADVKEVDGLVNTSWLGISANVEHNISDEVIIEVDFVKSFDISVDRFTLMPDVEGLYDRAIDNVIKGAFRQFLADTESSDFSSLNIDVSPVYGAGTQSKLTWKYSGPNYDVMWGTIPTPAADIFLPSHVKSREYERGAYKGGGICIVLPVDHEYGRSRLSSVFQGDRVVLATDFSGWGGVPCVLYTQPTTGKLISSKLLSRALPFPPEWSTLAAIWTGSRLILNADHHVTARIDEDVDVLTTDVSSETLEEHLQEAASDFSKAAALIFSNLSRSAMWEAATDRHRGLLTKVLATLSGKEGEILWWEARGRLGMDSKFFRLRSGKFENLGEAFEYGKEGLLQRPREPEWNVGYGKRSEKPI